MIQTQNTKSTYISPFTDFSFKRIFGSEASKGILKAFLNEVLEGRRTIETIEYSKNEYLGEIENEGGIVLDVVCTDQFGNTFLIEIQRAKQSFFKERSIFYASKLIAEQAPKGKRHHWQYDLKDVYLVAILENFELQDNCEEQYIHHICLTNKANGEIFYKKLGFTYIEMRNFVKSEQELTSKMDKWLFALKHMTEFPTRPESMPEPEFEQLFELARYANLNKEEKYMYDQSLKNKWDTYGALEYSKKVGLEQGIAEGIEQGMKKGMERGIERGLAQGRIQGEIEKAKAIARILKEDGLDITYIAKSTGLRFEEIESL
ncbi:Rpn family recombination-promoting nuclease/putative transposase [Pedobacter faecalis]|uniref:Rpn family recombination-promoting nuclease/putative transposase n=1 Tax=Pedobacter faecalis TaxID=3041495 RepID=UPI00254FDBB6|nr:Rpn family recombination-promoting nuclease/putative transposase [Pedobacter sp. ELA7]